MLVYACVFELGDPKPKKTQIIGTSEIKSCLMSRDLVNAMREPSVLVCVYLEIKNYSNSNRKSLINLIRISCIIRCTIIRN